MKKLVHVFLLVLAFVAYPAQAKLKAIACEPEWGALLQELGGTRVSVYVATTAQQDPHRIEPRPSLIAKVRNADLVACTGAELEIGWLPVLLQQASSQVQPGQPGYFEAASFVTLVDKPTSLDRAQGDIHVAGNPHIQTDPRNIARVAQALADRLAQLDNANAGEYRARYADFDKRWKEAIARWEQQASSLKGLPIVTHHKGWTYLVNWLGLKEIALLEPKPGLPPTASHLATVLERVRQTPTRFIIRAPYEDARADQWLSERAGIPAVVLPFTVGGSAEAKDLFSLFDATLKILLQPPK